MRYLWLLTACIATVFSGFACAHSSKLALGDGKFSNVPKRGYVMTCQSRFPGGGGAHRVGAWVKQGYWMPAEKPMVPGDIAWPNAKIHVSIEDNFRVVRSNQLPKHNTGQFPIPSDSQAYQYDRNPNAIREQSVLLKLPATPQVIDTPTCVPMGMIGFALSGVAIFNAFDLQGRDAPAYEIQDRCSGHPEIGGAYHYHDWSSCMVDKAGSEGKHSDVVGFMLDGFPIYGPKGEKGLRLSNKDLDECHGHRGEVILDAKKTFMYHYHFTQEYPYTIGCFRGKVLEDFRLRRPPPPPPPL
jgi:YHYH protein